MSVCYYCPNLLRNYEGKNDAFLTSLVVCKHDIYLRRQDSDRIKMVQCKAYSRTVSQQMLLKLQLLSWSTVITTMADEAASAQLITLILSTDELVLHKNGQARNNTYTLYLIIQPYCVQKIFKIGSLVSKI